MWTVCVGVRVTVWWLNFTALYQLQSLVITSSSRGDNRVSVRGINLKFIQLQWDKHNLMRAMFTEKKVTASDWWEKFPTEVPAEAEQPKIIGCQPDAAAHLCATSSNWSSFCWNAMFLLRLRTMKGPLSQTLTCWVHRWAFKHPCDVRHESWSGPQTACPPHAPRVKGFALDGNVSATEAVREQINSVGLFYDLCSLMWKKKKKSMRM